MAATPPLTQLGRYVIVRTLGRGAMGVVYEAHDPKLERTVAIKTILKGHLLDSTMAADYSARFVREAQAVARLAHPNIVTVFDFGEQDEVAYLVMEFIRGRELAASFDAGDHLDLRRGLQVMAELLEALAYAHERGIVHRDVKPANVMIDATGHVKLTDFGVARLADSNSERTLAGTMVGTPSYMSPEQIQGLAVGSRADLFAAGVILYQFLTGRKPFAGDGAFSIQKAIVHDDPVPPTQLNRALPPQFDAIVGRALAKDPAERFASAAAFAQALHEVAGPGAHESAAGTTSAPPRQAAATAASPPAPADAEATIVRPGPRSPPLAPPPASPAPPQASGGRAAGPGSVAPTPPHAAGQPGAVPTEPAAPPVASRPVIVGTALAGLAIVAALAFVLSRPAPSTAGSAGPSAPASAPVATTMPPPGPAAPPAAASPVAESPEVAPPTHKAPAAAADGAQIPAARDTSAPPAASPAEAARKPAAAAPARAATARCSELLQRLQLGDTLAPSDLDRYRKECQR